MGLLEENYRSSLRRVDFTDTQGARKTINMWVKGATEERIQDLIPPDILTANTRLVSANAIYFKAAWAFESYREETRPRVFHPLDGAPVEVPTMHRSE